MSNSMPEQADCQMEKAKEILAQAKNPREQKLAEEVIKLSTGLTTSDLNAIIKEVGGKPLQTPVSKVIQACNQPSDSPAKKKAIEESKKLIASFKENLATYPKPLTYEGSVVFCVAISVEEAEGINLNGLPQVDRELIVSQLPPDAVSKLASGEAFVDVKYDEMKDFILTYEVEGSSTPTTLKFFNTVIHPQKLADTHVPVEKEGGKVTVGGNLVLDQRRIQRLVGVTPEKNRKDDEEEQPQRRQAVAGRNAYEIRADVLQMAIDWILHRDQYRHQDESDVINLAKKFYSFVEDRRR